MIDASRLFRPSPPYLHLMIATPGEAWDAAWSLQRTPNSRAIVRVLRGSKARTADRLFDEFAAALQFPHYFGENWNALDECLNDLEWLPGDSYTLFFTHSRHVLDEESPGQLSLLMQILEGAADASGAACKARFVAAGPAVPHCLSVLARERTSARWAFAGTGSVA